MSIVSEGQALALKQLERIAGVPRSALRILPVEWPAKDGNVLQVHISLDCAKYQCKDGGLPLHGRENFCLRIPVDFPYAVPTVVTVHTRFHGFRHVQWRKQLCLYLSEETQWRPSEGMYGFICQLDEWLRKGARNELDDINGPQHPPIAYSRSKTTVCVHADTPGRDHWPWFGCAHLELAKPNLMELVGWSSLFGLEKPEACAPAILLDFEMSFEYPDNLGELIRQLESNSLQLERIPAMLLKLARLLPEGQQMYMVIGAPSRGIVKDPTCRRQHLAVWEIPAHSVSELRGIASKYEGPDRPTGFYLSPAEAHTEINSWNKTYPLNWCPVIENRPEIVDRRDRKTVVDWFRGKRVVLWGCGALGSAIAEYLTRVGVKHIDLYDCGQVTYGLLVRQNFTKADIGDNKVDALKRRLDSVAQDIEVCAFPADVLDVGVPKTEFDVLIDTTASLRVRHKLETLRKQRRPQSPTISMMISGGARHGLAVIIPSKYSGGPLDAVRKLGLAVESRSQNEHWAEAFWRQGSLEGMRQPEPGCSSPTFVGSHADVVGLAARMLNRAAKELKRDKIDATGCLFAQDAKDQSDFLTRHSSDIVIDVGHWQFRLAHCAWQEIRSWIRTGARQRSGTDETGGLLFGELDETLGIVWISRASGPPAGSSFSPSEFVCGPANKDPVCQVHKERSRGAVTYLGMWHSHPNGSAEPSTTDRRAMEKALGPEFETGFHHVMLIVGHSSSLESEIGVHLFEKSEVGAKEADHVLPEPVASACVSATAATFPDISIGLALSGGGSRAIAFHLGCLRALNELGILRHVNTLSTVSGGSVIGALYASSEKEFEDFEKEIRVLLRKGLVRPTLQSCTMSLEGLKTLLAWCHRRVTGSLSAAVSRMIGGLSLCAPAWFREHSQSCSLAKRPHLLVNRTALFQWFLDRKVFKGRRLQAVSAKRPQLIINTTELQTGTSFYFGSRESGCWRYGKLVNNDVSLGHAVAASAAYPSLLPALEEEFLFARWNGEKRSERVMLADGGIYDNLGMAPFWPDRDSTISVNVKEYDMIICCRAGYGVWRKSLARSFVARLMRAFETTHNRAQNATIKRLLELQEIGKVRSAIMPYLGQDDNHLAFPPQNLVKKSEVEAYPTDFNSMPEFWIDKLSNRGEQLTRALITEYASEILEPTSKS